MEQRKINLRGRAALACFRPVATGRLLGLGENFLLMRLIRWFFVIAGTISLLVVAGGWVLTYTFKAEPLLRAVEEFSSPDNRMLATLEELDNGLGFGQGMLYDEIHIRQTGERIVDHGDYDRSVIFYADSMGASNGDRPKIKWIDSSHLLIVFSPQRIESGIPGKAIKEYRGVQISYSQNP